jgi:hypothetical protein
MTWSEGFVSRWSRLKRQPAKLRRGEPEDDAPPSSVAAREAEAGRQATEEQSQQAFDTTRLPSIESITLHTDVRAFLQSGVPEELKRSALRRAWAADPAIRDFIGIAENQWDFTDPNGIPGFGPLRDNDSVPALLAQALGGLDKVAEGIAEVAVPDGQEGLTRIASSRAASDGPTEPVREQLREPVAEPEIAVELDRQRHDPAEPDREPTHRRRHGGAVPD